MKKKSGLRSCLMIAIIAISILAMIVYLCIPHAPKTAAELYGNYILDCELVHGKLILNPDGTFMQTMMIKATGEKFSAKGEWTYATEKSYGMTFGEITFDGMVGVLEWPNRLKRDYASEFASPKSGIGIMPAEYRFGRLLLGGSVDSWPDWKKQD